MAKVPAHSARVYLDEFAASSDITSFGQEVKQETPLVTGLGVVGPRRVVGNYDANLDFLGLLEPVADELDDKIFALLGDDSDHHFGMLPGGTAIGSVAYDLIAQVTQQPRQAAIGQAILLNFNASGRNALARGNVLAHGDTVQEESLAGVNQGAKSSGPLYAVTFRLVAFSGTNITLKVQESSDDGSGDAYADVSGLTSGALTAPGVVRATTSGAIEAWRRLDISGTFSSATVVVTAGLVAGT